MNNDYNNILAEYAYNYPTLGFAIHPLISKRKEPSTRNGCKDASKDPDVITAWLNRWPDANIGIATGKASGFWVLDIDGEAGKASLHELEQKYGDLPATKEVITGTGGRHLYFLMPHNIEISNSVRRLGPGLDVRGDGGYVVAPPSVHPNGNTYEWAPNSGESIQAAPEWLLNLLKAPADSPKHAASSDWRELIKGVPEGQRNDALARISGALLSSNLSPDIAKEICFALNDARFEPPMDYEEVERTFNSIAQREASKKEPEDVEIEMVCLDDVKMEKTNWLWPNRIARGKFTVIAGDPGLGKSQITANLAATVTAGQKWPDTGESCTKGNVIILSAEDDVADTIKPRLIAAGADVKHCHILKAVCPTDSKGKKIVRSFDLKQDTDKLEKAIVEVGNVSLIIIDPISAYMGKTDSNNNSEVRRLLAPLADLAARADVAIIVVTHLNKSQGESMLYNVIGSIGLVAAARCAYGVVKDKINPEIRYFIPIKNNIGNDRNGFSFQIESVTVGQDIKTSRIRWDGPIDAQDVLKKNEIPDTEAVRFLKEVLSDGPRLKSEIDLLARQAGLSDSSLHRAKDTLGIQTKKLGFNDGWEWSFPPKVDLPRTMIPSVPSGSSILPSLN